MFSSLARGAPSLYEAAFPELRTDVPLGRPATSSPVANRGELFGQLAAERRYVCEKT